MAKTVMHKREKHYKSHRRAWQSLHTTDIVINEIAVFPSQRRLDSGLNPEWIEEWSLAIIFEFIISILDIGIYPDPFASLGS
jgi:hypothetical protein